MTTLLKTTCKIGKHKTSGFDGVFHYANMLFVVSQLLLDRMSERDKRMGSNDRGTDAE